MIQTRENYAPRRIAGLDRKVKLEIIRLPCRSHNKAFESQEHQGISIRYSRILNHQFDSLTRTLFSLIFAHLKEKE